MIDNKPNVPLSKLMVENSEKPYVNSSSLLGEVFDSFAKIFSSKYPFKEGDDYWTIHNGKAEWSCWDDISEQLHDENPHKLYFKSEEDALNYLNKIK